MKNFGKFCYVNYSYVDLIMFNKVFFWIFVWLLKFPPICYYDVISMHIFVMSKLQIFSLTNRKFFKTIDIHFY